MQTIANYPTQTNTKSGFVAGAVAGEDLTGKEAHIVVGSVVSGVPEFSLPATVNDPAEYLLLAGAAAGEPIVVLPLDRTGNVRISLSGTCDGYENLFLAAIDGTDDGKVRSEPAAAGTYYAVLRSEEAGVDGQHVLCRILPGRVAVTVSE